MLVCSVDKYIVFLKKGTLFSKIIQVFLSTVAIFTIAGVLIAGFYFSREYYREKNEKHEEIAILPFTYIPDAETILPNAPAETEPRNFGVDYDYPQVAQRDGTVRIPVLTYHQVGTLPASGGARDYYVSPGMFDRQMAYLKQKQYKTLTMQEFYDLVKSGENPVQKSVLITFDDGNYNNYSNAYPILKKYGFVATFFIVSSKSGISSAHLKEMVADGMDIESHSATHKDLTKIEDESELSSEIISSRYATGSLSGSTVISFSYPGCVGNHDTISYVISAGYSLDFKERLSGICNYTAAYE